MTKLVDQNLTDAEIIELFDDIRLPNPDMIALVVPMRKPEGGLTTPNTDALKGDRDNPFLVVKSTTNVIKSGNYVVISPMAAMCIGDHTRGRYYLQVYHTGMLSMVIDDIDTWRKRNESLEGFEYEGKKSLITPVKSMAIPGYAD